MNTACSDHDPANSPVPTVKPGRPKKYQTEEERLEARRAQTRKAVRNHDKNKKADRTSQKRSLDEASDRLEELIERLNDLAQLMVTDGPPRGCAEIIRNHAHEAKVILDCVRWQGHL